MTGCAPLVATVETLTRAADQADRELDDRLRSREAGDMRAAGEVRAHLRRRIEDAQREVDERLTALAATQTARAELGSVAPVSWRELQRCLRPGEAYLGFLHDIRTFRTLVTADSMAAGIADHELDAAALAAVARSGRDVGGADPAGVRDLMGPIPASIDTIVVAPDSTLVGVPWPSLPWTGGTRLGDHYAVAVVPAATVLHRLRDSGRPRPPVAASTWASRAATRRANRCRAPTPRC